MVNSCLVWGCTNRANDTDCKRSFYEIPRIIKHQGEATEVLSRERRELWLTRINRKDFDPDPTKRYWKVCSDHFVTGNKANLYNKNNPDWAPSLKLGPLKSSMKRYNRCKQRQQKRGITNTCFLDKGEFLNNMGEMPDNVCLSKTTKFILLGKLEMETSQDASVLNSDADLLQKYRAELQKLTYENRELKESIAKQGYSLDSSH